MLNEETLYARFISGELSESEIEALKANGDWDKLTAISEMTGNFSLPALDKKKGFEEVRERRIKALESRPVRIFNLKMLSGIAASVVILVVSLFWWNDSGQTLDAAYGESLAYNFVDNSEVVLNAGSSIKFVEKGWEKDRRVVLDGEAFFSVNKGDSFLVETSEGTVEVLGTKFNVKARSGNFEVECYEGKVAVKRKGTSTILSALKAVYHKGEPVVAIGPNRAKPNWMNGLSVFRNEKLEVVLDELERQYAVTVSTKEKGNFTGSFVHSDLKLAVEQIAKPLDLKASISSDGKSVIFTN